MLTTSDYIAATFGVTMAQAHDFIMAHVSDAAYIYSMATQYHVTGAMLGEITGYSATDVEGVFAGHGLDPMALQAPTTAPPATTGRSCSPWRAQRFPTAS